ncbi:MAG TPA: class I SAM-dependent methyltransferase [Vicinamibacterales bacterium]|nr:class I SAM-dependent methyltransferase [Vicinamibacterales bacterium]
MADPPSPFIETWIARHRPRAGTLARALDVAMGRGRHAALLADAGYQTFGVDLAIDALCEARASVPRLHVWCADLASYPLPRAHFDLVVVARYLQRDLFGALQDAIVPGGVMLYETFTIHQRQLGRGPTSADHLLQPGELRARFDGFDVLAYEEVSGPDAVARLAARKRP